MFISVRSDKFGRFGCCEKKSNGVAPGNLNPLWRNLRSFGISSQTPSKIEVWLRLSFSNRPLFFSFCVVFFCCLFAKYQMLHTQVQIEQLSYNCNNILLVYEDISASHRQCYDGFVSSCSQGVLFLWGKKLKTYNRAKLVTLMLLYDWSLCVGMATSAVYVKKRGLYPFNADKWVSVVMSFAHHKKMLDQLFNTNL